MDDLVFGNVEYSFDTLLWRRLVAGNEYFDRRLVSLIACLLINEYFNSLRLILL